MISDAYAPKGKLDAHGEQYARAKSKPAPGGHQSRRKSLQTFGDGWTGDSGDTRMGLQVPERPVR